MATIGTLKSTGRKYYFTPCYDKNGNEYWTTPSVKGKFTRDEIDGLPMIRRKEFLSELRALLVKYNASIDVSYDETTVLGNPFETEVYIGDYAVLKIDGSGIDANSINF